MYRALLNPSFTIAEREHGLACVNALWVATIVLLYTFGIWLTAQPV